LKLLGKLLSSHWERRGILRELETRVPEMGRLMLRDRKERGRGTYLLRLCLPGLRRVE